ncbi:MAG: hypothetical protein LQ347_004705, partial [Umbilicaria vellea]
MSGGGEHLKDEILHSTARCRQDPPPAADPPSAQCAPRSADRWFSLQRHIPDLSSHPSGRRYNSFLERKHPRRTPLHPLRLLTIQHLPLHHPRLAHPPHRLPTAHLRRKLHLRCPRRRDRHHPHLPARPPPHPLRRPRQRKGLPEPRRRHQGHLAPRRPRRLLPRPRRRRRPSRAVHGPLLHHVRSAALPAGDAVPAVRIRRRHGRSPGQHHRQDGHLPARPDPQAPAGARPHEGPV